MWKEATETALDVVKKAGVTIYHPDKTPFISRVEDIFEGYESQPRIYDLIRRIRKLE